MAAVMGNMETQKRIYDNQDVNSKPLQYKQEEQRERVVKHTVKWINISHMVPIN